MKRGPKAIGDVLSELMSRRGLCPRAERAPPTTPRGARRPARWRPKYTRPGLLRRGTLEVVVANSTLVQELGFQKNAFEGPGEAPARRGDREPSVPRGERGIESRCVDKRMIATAW